MIESTWSCSSNTPPRVIFYVPSFPDTEIALAPGITSIEQVTDADSLTYEASQSAGTVQAGEFVFMRHLLTGFHAAFRFDDADCSGETQGTADLTWYLQQDGSADFSRLFLDGFETGDSGSWTSTP